MQPIISLMIVVGVLYCFWLFIKTATPRQMGKFLLVIAVILLVGALFILAVMKRLPLAVGILMALWPLLAAALDIKRRTILEGEFSSEDIDNEDDSDVVDEQDLYDDAPYIYSPRVRHDFNKSA
jgi:predicted membrane protein